MANLITEKLQCRYPILSAPMANVATGKLAKAVSDAGGFGFIGAGYSDALWVEAQFKASQHANIGIGFISWYLHQYPEILAIALTFQPKAVMFSFGDFSPFVDQVKATGALILAQVQTVQDAIVAEQQGADFIVAQGAEAGGHIKQRSTFALVPAIVDKVSVPVIAAGGIADARGYIAALALGAKAVLMGTRFYAASEAGSSKIAQRYIVSAKGDETLVSTIPDQLRSLNWPNEFAARSLNNAFMTELLSKEITEVDKLHYAQAQQQQNYDIAAIFAGECVDLIHDILPAKVIIDNIVTEAQSIMQQLKLN